MIGIIGAMDIEIDALKKLMENQSSETVSGIEFTSGIISGKEVVLAVCGIGKVFAAVCAQTMILKYGVSHVINTGVGGSLSVDLNIGDIAVAKYAVQHDMDTSSLGDPPGLISGINVVRLPADKELCEKISAVTDKLGLRSLVGTIASGDQFVAEASQKTRIANNFDAIACEMEGAAIGQVCCINHVPFAIIRSISDNANGEANEDYSAFRVTAAENSKAVVVELLKVI